MFLILKKYWLFTVLAFIAGLVVFLKLVISPSVPVETPTASLPQPSIIPLPEAPSSVEHLLGFELPDFPKKLAVYKDAGVSEISPGEAKKIATSFGFTDEPKTSRDIEQGTYFSWSDHENYLTLGGKPLVINFGSNSLLEIDSLSSAPTLKSALEKSEQILKQKGLDHPLLDLQNPEVNYYQIINESLKSVGSINEGQIIEIGFHYKLNGLLLLNSAPKNPTVSVFLGPNGELLKLNFIKYSEEFIKDIDVPLLSKEEIAQKLKNREGTVVYSLSGKDKDVEVPPNYQFNVSRVKNATLAYYYPTTSSGADSLLIQSVFVFEAETTDQKTGKSVSLVIYLPAAK